MPRIYNSENRVLLLESGFSVPAMGYSANLSDGEIAAFLAKGSVLQVMSDTGQALAGNFAIIDQAPWHDVPVITAGAGTPTFATQTQHFPKRTGADNSFPVDMEGDPKFRYPAVPPGVYVNYQTGATVRTGYIPGGDSQGRLWDGQIEFVTSSKYVALVWLPSASSGNNMMIVVNGRPVSSRLAVDGQTGSTSFVLLTFPDNRSRKVKFIVAGGQRVWRFETEAAYPPVRSPSAGKTLVVIGDSLCAGAGTPPGGATFLDTWPQWTALALGFDHCCNASIGGSRWVQRTGTSPIELSHFGGGRLAPALALNPEAIVFAGSRNDTDSAATITAAVQAALQDSTGVAMRYVTGTFTPLSQNAAVRAGAVAEGVTFLDMTDGLQAGDIGVDGVHPTYQGALNLRNRIALRLMAAGCRS